MHRFKLDDRCRAETMRLLTPGQQGLPKETAHRFAAIKPEKAGTRSETKEFLGPGRAQPLKIDRKPRPVELIAAMKVIAALKLFLEVIRGDLIE
jgi:hypothetical protein